jgi:hypothetical protein
MTDTNGPEDDPIDDSTHWIGNLPETPTDSTECPTERDTGRPQQSDILSKKPPVAERR